MEQTKAIIRLQMQLFTMQDMEYRDFHSKLMPTIPKECVIGIRMPDLRKFAREYAQNPDSALFLQVLPHRYYEENNLHMLLLCGMKDYGTCIEAMEAFLPYVDNWATCDIAAPKCFGKNKPDLLRHVRRWLNSSHPYTQRYAMGILMSLFLDEDFSPEFPDRIASLRSEEYYVNMMIAWYFATALAKQWETILPFLTEHRLSDWCHNKTIQKAIESYRITSEQKELLRSLKIK